MSWEVTPLYCFSSNKRSPLKWKFWDFLVLRSKFVKYLMSILKQQVNSSLNVVSLFSFMKDNFYGVFSSSNIYFAQKESIKMKDFRDFRVLRSKFVKFLACQLWNDKSIPLQILRHSSLSRQITPLGILSSYFFNFGLKDPIKISILRLSSALVKMCYIPHAIF